MVSKTPRLKKGAALLFNERLLSLVTILVAISLIYPHLGAYAWDYDEGPALLAAKLGRAGFALYDEIVYNKPPLLVWYLRLAFAVGGPTLQSARLAILLLNAAGLLALGELARRWWGQWAGLATIFLFLLVPETAVRLPVVMNDLPAMSLAAMTLLAVTHYRLDGRAFWLFLGGIGFALTLGFHPLYIFLTFPLFLLLIYPLPAQQFSLAHAFRVLLLFATAAAIGIAAWLLPVRGDAFNYWVLAYNRAPLSGALLAQAQNNGVHLLAFFLVKHLNLTILLLVSIALLARKQISRYWVGIALLWFYLVTLSLYLLQPMWRHYPLLALQPVLLFGGGGLAVSILHLKNAYWQQKRPIAAMVALSTGLLVAFHGTQAPRVFPEWTAELTAVNQVLETQPPNQFILADNQFLIFTSGHLTPPALTDTSNKREATGFIAATDIFNAYWAYRPAFILFENLRLDALPPVRSWAQQITTNTRQWDGIDLYQLPATPQDPLEIRQYTLEPGLVFRGFTLANNYSGVGTEIALDLFWQAATPLPENYHLFVHLLDQNGALVAQQDTLPGGAFFPTSSWSPGVTIVERLHLPLPDALSAGTYRLVLGMYTYPDVQRLPVFDESGRQLPDGIIPLTEIMIPTR